jgi:hyperosmotically inducible periplasmic protein
MKRNLRHLITASAACVLAFSAVAQNPATPQPDRSDATRDRAQNRYGHQSGRLGGATHDRMSDTGQANRIQGATKASDIIGMTVKNRQDETLGKVSDLAVDLESGRIVVVVISSGGFLGMGQDLSAVPPTALAFNTERDGLELDTNKEQLGAAPRFKSNEWPDFAEPGYVGGVYRAYQVEPYFHTTATAQPDNTGRNVRDRGDRTLTPFDHGSSKADVNTTAEIRKAINASSNMSVNAKNVKVITAEGKVTLRGPVDSAEEKRLIGDIANRVASAGNVDNQLEVKSGATSSSLPRTSAPPTRN